MTDTYKFSYKVGDNLLSSLSVYNVGYQKCEPGYQWGWGVRDHYCIHQVISGTGFYIVDESQYQLAAGDTFIIYPHTEVKYYADLEEPWEYAWVGFMGTDAGSIIRATDFTKSRPLIEKDPEWFQTIRRQLEAIYQVKGNTYRAAVAMTGALYTLLSTFMQCAKTVMPLKDPQLLCAEKAKSYIAANYSYPITVEDIAHYTGISRSHLFRLFQTYLEKSPKEYLTAFRINQAEHLLKETPLSIAAIAYSVGYENNLYFSRVFKAQTGMSPSEYRIQNNETKGTA